MKLMEILNFDVMQRCVKRMKQNAKRQAEQAKAVQARLKIQKAQQELALSTKSIANNPKI